MIEYAVAFLIFSFGIIILACSAGIVKEMLSK